MQFIKHRINLISELMNMDSSLGAEIDLRSDVNRASCIHLAHDPWTKGDQLVHWLETYKHKGQQGTVIFNTKEDGLEDEVFRLACEYEIENFFFLDTALPTFIRYINSGKGQWFACRVSKYELLDSCEIFAGRATWAWVDCFEGIPLELEIVKRLSQNFKTVLVSPELQKMNLEHINQFVHLKPYLHSICTKRPDLWV